MHLNGRPSLIDPLSDVRWDPFVSSHPYGTIYHHSDWLRVIQLTYGQIEPLALVLEEGGRITSALVFCIVRSRLTGNRIVSLPFTSYCDPLVSCTADFSRLLDGILEHVSPMGPSRYYELRALHAVDHIKDDRLKAHHYYKIHLLDLGIGFDKVQASFHRDCIRKSVRKAMRSGIIVRAAETEQDLKAYYFFHGRSRRKLGLPIQPYNFFRNMWQIMAPSDHFALLLAELEGEIIGGLIVFKFRTTVSMEHIGTDTAHLLLRPNHLLYWKAIEMACDEGYLCADFGKTTPDNQGLLDFKRRWGAEMYEVPYFYYPRVRGITALEQTNHKYRSFAYIGRHIPLVLARPLGSLVYRHMG